MLAIQKATQGDIELIRQLTFQVWPQTYSNIISKDQIDYMLDMMYSPASLQKQMEEGAEFILLYENEMAKGFASIQPVSKEVFKLHKLYVLPDMQGKGAGKFLLKHIEDEMRKRGASVLQLQVNKQNKAKQFYEKMGFVVAQEAVFDIGNGYVMDDYVMEKAISA